MYYPCMSGGKKTRRQTVKFGGLNYTENVREGELADSVGVSWRAWPCLCQRPGRRSVGRTDRATALYAFGKLVTVEGEALRYDGQRVGTVTAGEKQFAVVNTKLCIFPDQKYLDLETLELHDLGAKAVSAAKAVFTQDTLTLSTAVAETECLATGYRLYYEYNNGNVEDFLQRFVVWDKVHWDKAAGCFLEPDQADGATVGQTVTVSNGLSRPQDLVGKYVIFQDTESGYALNTETVHTIYGGGGSEIRTPYGAYNQRGLCGKIMDAALESVETPQVQVNWKLRLTLEVHDVSQSEELESLFRAGDVVTVSGCQTQPDNNRQGKLAAVEGECLTFEAPIFLPGEETVAVTVEREIPHLDFICESDNRLFGVSNADGRIYASALGDPGNFYDYSGQAHGSYTAWVGTDGDFTGCAAYSGKVLFFKEECIHRLLGSTPASYAVYTDHMAGLQAGSHRSLWIINEVLYYKGREGVYAYAGSTPRLISGPLGNVGYRRAAGGSAGSRYYLSMEREDTQVWELLVYDTLTGLWVKEEERQATAFARLEGTLYMLSQGELWALDQGEDDQGTAIAWEATFVPFTETVHQRKYPSRLLLRLELEEGAWVEAQIARDKGAFESVWTSHDCHASTAVIPIRPGRCDRYQVKLRGEGRCLLRGLAREFSLGGVG